MNWEPFGALSAIHGYGRILLVLVWPVRGFFVFTRFCGQPSAIQKNLSYCFLFLLSAAIFPLLSLAIASLRFLFFSLSRCRCRASSLFTLSHLAHPEQLDGVAAHLGLEGVVPKLLSIFINYYFKFNFFIYYNLKF